MNAAPASQLQGSRLMVVQVLDESAAVRRWTRVVKAIEAVRRMRALAIDDDLAGVRRVLVDALKEGAASEVFAEVLFRGALITDIDDLGRFYERLACADTAAILQGAPLG